MNQRLENYDDLQIAGRLAYLIPRHIQNTLSPEERSELNDWVSASAENLELFKRLTNEDNIGKGIERYLKAEKAKAEAFAQLQQKIRKKKSYKTGRWFVAASLILAVVSFYITQVQPKKNYAEKPTVKSDIPNDIAPGQNKAVLTLSTGKTIILDSSVSATLAKEGEVNISQHEGELVYSGRNNETKFNTVSVPRGGQYRIVLADGTKVWLNAESTLKYPANFTGNSREITLTGEGFFDVAKDATKPFSVVTISKNGASHRVTALGTHFNINAYEDEGKIFTTLVEGSVKVENNHMIKILKPGQQAASGGTIEVIAADTDEVVAWKEGKFLFHDATIQSIGEQIKRWYDVEVEYQGKITPLFNTEASRNVPLSKLLDGLAGTGQVQFSIGNKKLVVKP